MQMKLKNLYQRLQGLDPARFSVAVGFDGFVDEIVEVVDRRESFDSYIRMTNMRQFGERITKAAGLSTNIEFVPKTMKLGGNGPIMGNALVKAGTSVSYVGALGNPNIHPVFTELTDACTQVFSVAEPGHTDAVEFDDGKVMLGKMESLNDVNWATLQREVGDEQLRKIFSGADLVATVNWTMTPYMNEVWEGLLGLLSERPDGHRPFFFVDLADPSKRTPEDIVEALTMIRRFSSYYRVILGLNRKEASEIACVRGLSLSKPAEEADLEEIVKALGADLGLWCLVVHPTFEAGAYVDGEYHYIEGPYTSKPRLTTGAGDNFNAGFCLGLMLQLGVEESLAVGKATSGYYVRNMHSPSRDQLLEFIKLWADRAGQEF
ncbi:MAG TPA: carbohydrate kinase family protein [Firmicutes bacterium]|nr:carbohydrate kinase family protein [Bacillota bacterium]